MGENYALELRDISKSFGSVQANDHVDLTLRKSEILAILGENGSGKTTLMNMIYGIYYPDEGHIFVNGKEVTIRSPKDSYELGIGMVHQHFKLVDVLTAAENIVLGLPGKGKLDMKKITEDIQKLVDKYGFELDLSQKIYEMSVSQKQTVEIIKMLYRGARILILDEPTAVLTPQESDRLFDILRNMRKDGCSIMIITHKLQEVLALSDRVAILRKGKYIDTVETAQANAQSLSEMMVGGRVDLNIDRPEPENVKKRLVVKGLNCKNKEEVKTLDDVDLTVNAGEILGIAGISGSGQKEFLEAIAGLQAIESGSITLLDDNGKEVTIRSPKDSYELGIGMVHQHFKLVDVLTAAENIVLGLPGKGKLDMKKITEDIQKLVDKYGFELDLSQKIYEMSVSQKQTVEIIKMLYRGARILILDEPTAVLTPQESDRLFDILRNMRKDGCSIMIITHKLQEVLALSDRVAILRKGKYIDTVETAQANAQSLSEMMVGGRVDLNIDRPEPENVKKRLVVKGLNCKNKEEVKTLDDVDLTVNAGEILGIAGISGSGQKEFLEAIAGLQAIESGSITLLDDNGKGTELAGMDSISINKAGISLAFVPEDRIGMGLVGDMDMTDNMMLRSYRNGKSPFLDRKGPKALALKIKEQLEVMTPSISAPVRQMSGGNVQKVLVGREIAQNPKVLLVAFPTRGVDVNTSHVIYRLLNEQKKKGVAVVCVIEDLDVVLELCDRIAVFCGGKISGIEDGRTATKEEIGLLMTKHEKGGTQA